MARNWYDQAEWYEIAFGWDASAEIAALQRIFEAFAPRPVGRVYEPFCGCGRLSIPLARAGFDVVGADLNPAMIHLATRRAEPEGIRVEHHLADVRGWSPPGPIDAVVTLIDSFRHITDVNDARALLARWAEVVGRGGVVVIGLDLDDPGGGSCPPSEWTAARGGVEVRTRVETGPSPEPAWELMHARMTVRTPDGSTRSIESTQLMRRYTLDSLRRLAAEAALDLRRATGWIPLADDRPVGHGQAVVTFTAR
jgi:SAM-dependent methyltransferase